MGISNQASAEQRVEAWGSKSRLFPHATLIEKVLSRNGRPTVHSFSLSRMVRRGAVVLVHPMYIVTYPIPLCSVRAAAHMAASLPRHSIRRDQLKVRQTPRNGEALVRYITERLRWPLTSAVWVRSSAEATRVWVRRDLCQLTFVEALVPLPGWVSGLGCVSGVTSFEGVLLQVAARGNSGLHFVLALLQRGDRGSAVLAREDLVVHSGCMRCTYLPLRDWTYATPAANSDCWAAMGPLTG